MTIGQGPQHSLPSRRSLQNLLPIRAHGPRTAAQKRRTTRASGPSVRRIFHKPAVSCELEAREQNEEAARRITKCSPGHSALSAFSMGAAANLCRGPKGSGNTLPQGAPPAPLLSASAAQLLGSCPGLARKAKSRAADKAARTATKICTPLGQNGGKRSGGLARAALPKHFQIDSSVSCTKRGAK